MEGENAAREQKMHELNGAIAALDTLREKLALRLNEARDECMREALDNVIVLVGAHAREYQNRRIELQTQTTH